MLKNFFSNQILSAALTVFAAPQILAFVPALCLAAFWLGGEAALISVALGLPLVFSAASRRHGDVLANDVVPQQHGGLLPLDVFLDELERVQKAAGSSGDDAACLVVSLDEFDNLEDLHGTAVATFIAQRFCDRVLSMVRSRDIVARIAKNTFLVGLHPSRQLDLASCIQTSGRIQSSAEEPFPLDGTGIYLSCSVGFCLYSAVPDQTAADWVESARAALSEAQRNGPSTIRAYSSVTRRRAAVQTNFRQEFEAALLSGEIQPWFQPQISTDTGCITGFEALARWNHSAKGVVGPQVFLPFAEQANLMENFGQTIRQAAFRAMRDWDRAGTFVPKIGINFSSDELRDPTLVDRVKWELDQFDLTPDRLAVEILETVFSRRPDDVITHNVTHLSGLGCCIDLDDFGTGHASFTSIRRFDVSRLKIDRTFVSKCDSDPSQQQMVGAILTMAEQLNLETLAEGVETSGEHALVAQLGCHHVQGFGIGKPMPFDETLDWILNYKAKLKSMPKIGRKMGGDS